jgi:outer membrane protein assembly factor BamB
MNWDTGATLWQYTALPYDVCDCDFGEGPVDFTYHGQEYLVAGNKDGIVYALAPLKGGRSVQLVWSLKISKSGFLNYGGIFQPPTYSNGTIFVAGGPTPDGSCPHGRLYALQADTGAMHWSTCTPVQVVSPTSTTGDVLFVESGSTLLAYSSATGHELWQAQQSGEFWGGVSISRGFVLVAGVSGTLYCYGFSNPVQSQS